MDQVAISEDHPILRRRAIGYRIIQIILIGSRNKRTSRKNKAFSQFFNKPRTKKPWENGLFCGLEELVIVKTNANCQRNPEQTGKQPTHQTQIIRVADTNHIYLHIPAHLEQ